jgi:hypothetical protein
MKVEEQILLFSSKTISSCHQVEDKIIKNINFNSLFCVSEMQYLVFRKAEMYVT